jgi:hypothetical protein
MLGVLEKEIKDSPQPRFQLEVGLIGIARLRRLRPIEEILARLEALEQRLVQNGGTFGRNRIKWRVSTPVVGKTGPGGVTAGVSSESAEASPATVMAGNVIVGNLYRLLPVGEIRGWSRHPPSGSRPVPTPNSIEHRLRVRAHVPNDLAGSYPETEPVLD